MTCVMIIIFVIIFSKIYGSILLFFDIMCFLSENVSLRNIIYANYIILVYCGLFVPVTNSLNIDNQP